MICFKKGKDNSKIGSIHYVPYIFLKKISKSLAGLKIVLTFAPSISPDGGIGRRAGLKHQWGNSHAGSIPALGTRVYSNVNPFFFIVPLCQIQ